MRFIQFTQPNGRVAVPSARFGGRLAVSGIENELDWLFGTAFAGVAGPSRDGRFPVDLTEDKENVYIRAELPGVSRDSINVEFVDGTLTIEASRKEKSGEGEKAVASSRQVSIPDEVDGEKVSAAYENGVLTVVLPRKEAAKPKKIKVSVS
jgi:HSP20 family protein